MKEISERLEKLQAAVSGSEENKQTVSTIARLQLQLSQMIDDSDVVASVLGSFQENISSFGTWINSRKEQPLTLDSIVFASPEEDEYTGEAGILSLLAHYVKQFVCSFAIDYNSIGVIDADCDREISVWITSGRDQSLILKQLINDTFTPKTGINVKLSLVSPSALMPSIVSHRSPDVYMGIAEGDVVNLALRDAVTDVSQLDGFEEIKSRFAEKALVPFTYEGGIYALPDTMSFSMLFYRKDILAELGIETSELSTWESILENVLPELSVNSLTFGVPVSINSYLAFLFQNGGEVYLNGGRRSAFADTTAVKSMEKYTKLFTQYGLPLAFDFANRFRSGEMPVAIADYLQYNQLTVFAPEIKGLWSMLPIPGTADETGNINQTETATFTASIILGQCEDKASAFEFLKWWTSEDVQSEYGSNLESVVGSAARYNSANLNAINSTQWSGDIRKALNSQIEQLTVMPQVPGGYITTRYYDFAFRDIVYSSKNIKESMEDAAESINAELSHKRTEYGLDKEGD